MAQAKTPYLTNKQLLSAVKESKQVGKMTDKLALMLQLLCDKFAKKGNFVNYSYNEDMRAYAMLMLCRTWSSFDPEKSNNPFAFYTQCLKHSFIQFLNQEKRQRHIRDLLLVDQGLNPSFGYDENMSDQHIVEDEQDYYYHTEVAKALQQQDLEDELFFELKTTDSIDEIESPSDSNELAESTRDETSDYLDE